jgi:hypothetical protein
MLRNSPNLLSPFPFGARGNALLGAENINRMGVICAIKAYVGYPSYPI